MALEDRGLALRARFATKWSYERRSGLHSILDATSLGACIDPYTLWHFGPKTCNEFLRASPNLARYLNVKELCVPHSLVVVALSRVLSLVERLSSSASRELVSKGSDVLDRDLARCC